MADGTAGSVSCDYHPNGSACPNLGMPHIRVMGDGHYEKRVKAEEGIGRAFYCTLVG